MKENCRSVSFHASNIEMVGKDEVVENTWTCFIEENELMQNEELCVPSRRMMCAKENGTCYIMYATPCRANIACTCNTYEYCSQS